MTVLCFSEHLPLCVRKNCTGRVTEHWHREALESPSLEIIKSHLDIIRSNAV